MKVKTITKNECLIYAEGKVYLQSYDTIVAKKEDEKIPILYKDWDYSNTTMKYVCKFLCDVFHAEHIVKKDIIKMAKENKIIIVDAPCEI